MCAIRTPKISVPILPITRSPCDISRDLGTRDQQANGPRHHQGPSTGETGRRHGTCCELAAEWQPKLTPTSDECRGPVASIWQIDSMREMSVGRDYIERLCGEK